MASRVEIRRVGSPDVPWAELDRRSDRTVFQTREWLDFLVDTQRAEPVLARIEGGAAGQGWYTGALIRRGGFKVLGSPLRGWTTSYMGVNCDGPVVWTELLGALREFAFRELGCVHLEFMDHQMPGATVLPPGFSTGRLPGYELRIDCGDDALMGRMRPNGRRDVRRALRNGIEVEEVDPDCDPSFAAEYYSQVEVAFAKRGLVPTYPLSRVDAAIRHLHPTGRMLLLRARTPDGEKAATGIFLGVPGAGAVFWMGASHPEHQSLLPNEALMWHALRGWRDRGATRFDFGGGGHYKKKYGGTLQEVPWVRCSRIGALERGRRSAQKAYKSLQRRGRIPGGAS